MEMLLKNSFSNIRATFELRLGSATILTHLSVFIVLVAVSKFSLYIFYSLNTSPALIWPPVGIALAAVFLEGYSMWIPIALSQLFIQTISPNAMPVLLGITSIVAYTAQPLIGAYILKSFDFNPSFSRIRDAVAFVLIALLLPVLAAGAVSLMRYVISTTPVLPLWVSWSRAWAGGVMSILILTSCITSQFTRSNPQVKRRTVLEKTLACLSVAGATYVVFWTTLPKENVFLVLSLLFLTLLWVGLRTGPRIMTIALFIMALVGIAGSIIGHPIDTPLNQQLLSDELFIVLIAPIFLIFSSLVEERRVASVLLAENIENLQEALKKVSEEDQAKNDFLAILAHELRNPLASVVTNLEVVKMHTETIGHTDILKHADIAISHAGTVSHLLDDLLDVSRISKRKFKLQKQLVDLGPLIGHAIETIEPVFKARNQVLTTSVPKEKLILMADPLRLEQVIVNLLTNASKFSHKKGKVELRVLRTKHGEIRISVHDQGIGIKGDMLEEIFEPFAQLPDKKGISNSGLGIGLSLIKRLVELHDGRVWAQSAGPGQGSTFTVALIGIPEESSTFPLPSFMKARRKLYSFEKERDTNVKGAGQSVLIVDDNVTAAQGMATLLSHSGHDITVVHTGLGALEQIRGRTFSAILLDIGLPDIDGYEVARRLFKDYPESSVKVIALTGFGQAEDKAKTKAAGFSHHLTKPISLNEVRDILDSIGTIESM